MRKIKVVVLLVQQLQHGFTKNAKVSPYLTVAHRGNFSPVRVNWQVKHRPMSSPNGYVLPLVTLFNSI